MARHFRKNSWTDTQKEEAFQTFYTRWIKPGDSTSTEAAGAGLDVKIDAHHWNLLEANLTTALKLFAQAVEKAVFAPVHNQKLWPDADGLIIH